jgi:hypothetical protein
MLALGGHFVRRCIHIAPIFFFGKWRKCNVCANAARLVPVENDQLFTSLLTTLVDRLRNDTDDELLQGTIQAITAITYVPSLANRPWSEHPSSPCWGRCA